MRTANRRSGNTVTRIASSTLFSLLGLAVVSLQAAVADLPKPVANYRRAVKSEDVETYSRAALALRKWMIENDPHRPVYHFTGPEGWINDPKTDQFGMDGAVTKKASAWTGIVRDGLASQAIRIRIFLDRSILEIYCGGAALTGRTFSDPKALGVDLFADGGSARLESLDVWQMQPMWGD